MIDAVIRDVIVTWLGAAGCFAFLQSIWSQRRERGLSRAGLFLFGTLAALLTVRALFWMDDTHRLGQLTFLFAALLPLATTLFAEQVLRRHHPLWLKISAVVVTVATIAVDLAFDLAHSTPLLVGFLTGFLFVILANAWLLLAPAHPDLSEIERRVARAVGIAGLLAGPLVATDFRDELPLVPARLGAIGALVLVFALVHLDARSQVARTMLQRLLLVFGTATVLAAAFSALQGQVGMDLGTGTVRRLPVALAWVLLTSIVIQVRRLDDEGRSRSFLRWMLLARVDSLEGFLGSLRHLYFTADHVELGAAELAGYDWPRIWAALGDRREPAGRAELRRLSQDDGEARADVAEQVLDLLQRHGMTHALLVRESPPLALLVHAPGGAGTALIKAQAGVIQRLARMLAGSKA